MYLGCRVLPCLLFLLPGRELFYCYHLCGQGLSLLSASSPHLNKLECDVCVLSASLAAAIVSATVYEFKLAAVLCAR